MARVPEMGYNSKVHAIVWSTVCPQCEVGVTVLQCYSVTVSGLRCQVSAGLSGTVKNFISQCEYFSLN